MTEAPTIVWDATGRAAWDRLLTVAGRSPLEQSWAYGEALAGTRARRGVIERAGRELGLIQVFERRLGPLCLAQIIRGPVWLDGEPDIAAYPLIKADYRARSGKLLFWMPELPDGRDAEDLMRAAGLRRMTTGYSSAWVDLTRPEDELRRALHGKWRNMLTAAEKSDIRIDVHDNSGDLDWLLARYEAHRRRARYAGPTPGFIRAMAAAGADLVVLSASHAAEPVAGVLLIRHGAAATYYVGWAGDAGRRLRAHNLLLWRAMVELKNRGVSWLDLGGLNPAAPSVARFKMGLGGEFFTLSGTYV